MSSMKPEERVARIVRDAGGKIVGRTRLQKTAYLLDVAGFSDGFRFVYKHYGPYSEGIAESARMGALLGDLIEEEKQAAWGGTYSIYSVEGQPDDDTPAERLELASQASKAGPIALELATTAVFLSREGHDDPWAETKRRKPEKAAGGRLKKAKDLLRELRKIQVREPLPDIV